MKDLDRLEYFAPLRALLSTALEHCPQHGQDCAWHTHMLPVAVGIPRLMSKPVRAAHERQREALLASAPPCDCWLRDARRLLAATMTEEPRGLDHERT